MKKEDVILLDSQSYITPACDGKILVAGSHGARNVGEFTLPHHPKFCVLNDAGIGKNQAAVQGIIYLGENGIPACAVDSMTAMIGDATDTWENGIISFVNTVAEEMGVKIGMTVPEACDIVDRASR